MGVVPGSMPFEERGQPLQRCLRSTTTSFLPLMTWLPMACAAAHAVRAGARRHYDGLIRPAGALTRSPSQARMLRPQWTDEGAR